MAQLSRDYNSALYCSSINVHVIKVAKSVAHQRQPIK